MVRYKVNDNLKPGLMYPPHEFLEFIHPIVRIISKIRIHIIVVRYRVWRAGATFDPVS